MQIPQFIPHGAISSGVSFPFCMDNQVIEQHLNCCVLLKGSVESPSSLKKTIKATKEDYAWKIIVVRVHSKAK